MCGKTFRVAYCLTLHLRTHTDARFAVIFFLLSQKFIKFFSFTDPSFALNATKGKNFKSNFNFSFVVEFLTLLIYRFKSNSVYNHHLLTHSNVRGYQCPYCPKTFKTSVQLSGHKNSHTKPFSCNDCNRPFATLVKPILQAIFLG